MTVVATAVKMEDEGRSAVIDFPSLLKMMKPESTVKVGLSYQRSLYRWSAGQDTVFDWYRAGLSVIDVKPEEKKDAPSAAFTMVPSSQTIRAVQQGTGQLGLLFRKDKGEKVPMFTTVLFSLKGAHVTGSTPLLGTQEGEHLAQVDTMYLLNLGGLVPGSVVTLEAWRLMQKEGGKPTDTVPVPVTPLTLSVVGPEATRGPLQP